MITVPSRIHECILSSALRVLPNDKSDRNLGPLDPIEPYKNVTSSLFVPRHMGLLPRPVTHRMFAIVAFLLKHNNASHLEL